MDIYLQTKKSTIKKCWFIFPTQLHRSCIMIFMQLYYMFWLSISSTIR